jgi:hypothetical protein
MIRRLGRVAIYRQHLPGGNPDHDAYEVIVTQLRNTDHTGQRVETYESYPTAESWGKKGWTFTSLTSAVQKLKQLTGKASRTGTVSPKNRLDGSEGLRAAWGGLQGSASPLFATNDFAPPGGQSSSPPVERAAGISSGGMQCHPQP